VTVWNLLDILQYCGDRGMHTPELDCLRSVLIVLDICSAQLVLLLIEELLDSQSLAQCRTIFNFLESRREAIIAVCSLTESITSTDIFAR
jgi:THO complex subunit 1